MNFSKMAMCAVIFGAINASLVTVVLYFASNEPIVTEVSLANSYSVKHLKEMIILVLVVFCISAFFYYLRALLLGKFK